MDLISDLGQIYMRVLSFQYKSSKSVGMVWNYYPICHAHTHANLIIIFTLIPSSELDQHVLYGPLQ